MDVRCSRKGQDGKITMEEQKEVDVLVPEMMISLVRKAFSLQGLLRTVCLCSVWVAPRESEVEVEGGFSIWFWLREMNAVYGEERFFCMGEHYSESRCSGAPNLLHLFIDLIVNLCGHLFFSFCPAFFCRAYQSENGLTWRQCLTPADCWGLAKWTLKVR